MNFDKVLILGSGALKIGEAGEFDYSGSQALKAMRSEGIKTVLINPNIATVQTSEGVADKIYFLPVTPYFVEKVIAKERPQGILLAYGGQTALNCGVALFNSGVLDKYDVKVLGTPVQSIIDTEDRELFNKRMEEIDIKIIRSEAVESIEDAHRAAAEVGYPVILRAAYALGGLGSGFCDNEDELNALAEKSFSYSPQVLVEKSLKGWKEIEFEVVRDSYGHATTICEMENFDPLGIHTGESIVVSPCQSLNDHDRELLTGLALKIVKHIGIVGECNIQFAYEPGGEDYRVIEINARLSRSSALASKATGYPLAFVAAKIALGYSLTDLNNPASDKIYQPSIDYIVCKIPRWDLSKFHGVSREIGSSMKSVGEVMSIGKNFEETIQKGLRMIGQGAHGFVANKEITVPDIDEALKNPTDNRIFVISKAFQKGYTIDQIYDLTKIDKWFLNKLYGIVETSREIEKYDRPEDIPDELMRKAKHDGFSDFQIGRLVFKDKIDMDEASDKVRANRKARGLLPFVKRITTFASDDPDKANYLYVTYGSDHSDIPFDNGSNSIIVLGSGAYRIGSSVEFDWCSVNALNTIRKAGYTGIMINYNPETVSTDYDMCDRLYFDELTLERVLDVIDLEQPRGVIVSVGGQIPNNLAMKLHRQGVPVLGTSPVDIDRAENRDKFSAMLDKLGVDQPAWRALTSLDDIKEFVGEVGYPVLVRPSYVLSGAAMNVCYDDEELERFLKMATEVSKEFPVVVSQFMQETKEIEFDAVADKGDIVEYAISEHIEYAGVHSGDATMVFPAQHVYFSTIRQMKKIAHKIAAELNISGPFNIQFLAKNREVKVIECNLRASRSFPFVSKILKRNFIETATKIMLDAPYQRAEKSEFDIDRIGVKASQFSFARLQNADPVLGVDMSSTGEVGCLGDDLHEALLNALIATGYRIPTKAVLISSGGAKGKLDLLEPARQLVRQGLEVYATAGTAAFLNANGVFARAVSWPDEDDDQNVLHLIAQHRFDLIVNVPKNHSKRELTNGYRIRRAAIDHNIPLMTNTRLAKAFIQAFTSMGLEDVKIKSWQEYNA
ncbi:MAG: carbamoyl-phosphate synthase (glutamine-hydrolyzing) large subunit [Bacteroidales bacterium]|nr:carbamoyl-phosphate synthase (glutamine-hydrolyzing) large subunit [Bacteroidales bacterium]